MAWGLFVSPNPECRFRHKPKRRNGELPPATVCETPKHPSLGKWRSVTSISSPTQPATADRCSPMGSSCRFLDISSIVPSLRTLAIFLGGKYGGNHTIRMSWVRAPGSVGCGREKNVVTDIVHKNSNGKLWIEKIPAGDRDFKSGTPKKNQKHSAQTFK